MGRKVRPRRKSLTCWNSLFHQNPKLNVAQRHATHPQSLNLQRKCMLVNTLTYSKISLKLQQNQKRLENRALKCMRKMKVMEGVVTLCWSWLMSAKNKEARGSVYWESWPLPDIFVHLWTELSLEWHQSEVRAIHSWQERQTLWICFLNIAIRILTVPCIIFPFEVLFHILQQWLVCKWRSGFFLHWDTACKGRGNSSSGRNARRDVPRIPSKTYILSARLQWLYLRQIIRSYAFY